jgi:hypothetical protein
MLQPFHRSPLTTDILALTIALENRHRAGSCWIIWVPDTCGYWVCGESALGRFAEPPCYGTFELRDALDGFSSPVFTVKLGPGVLDTGREDSECERKIS